MNLRKRFLVIVNKYRCFFPLTDSQVAGEFLIRINNFELVETQYKDKSSTIELARCADKLKNYQQVRINVGRRA